MAQTDQGNLLRYRRIQLNPAWRDRKTFAAEHHLTYRVINDLENANRSNFEPATIAGAEVAYRLAPGSLRRTLAGGPLEPAPTPAPRRERPGPGRFEVVQGGGGQFRAQGTSIRAARDLSAATADAAAELAATIGAVEANDPGATGPDIFDDATLAGIWDLRRMQPAVPADADGRVCDPPAQRCRRHVLRRLTSPNLRRVTIASRIVTSDAGCFLVVTGAADGREVVRRTERAA